MAEGDVPKEFPDVSKKLAAPKHLSAYEKERQAALAKEKRAEAENAAALKAFEEDFASGDNNDESRDSSTGNNAPFPGYGPPPGRYGTPPGPRSGPGSLDQFPGAPPNMKRKRAMQEAREAQRAREEELRESIDQWSDSGDIQQSTQNQQKFAPEREQDLDTPRPAFQLSSLPPGTSTDDVKALLKDHVKVSSVRFVPHSGPIPNVRHSLSAVATLSADVSSEQINTALSALKQKYLGCGFYLSISRQLSYAEYHSSSSAAPPTIPFGAKKPQDDNARSSMRSAPPPRDHRGFAPPESYDSPSRHRYGGGPQPDLSVSVHPPMTIADIKAAHVIADALLLQTDPARAIQMEALLMSLPEVQKDERFAFLYDSRSPAGVYYRFLLWSPEDPDEAMREKKRRARGTERIHEDVDIDWIPPHGDVPFPDLQSLEQAVTDMDYASSDEDSDDEGGQRQFNSGRDGQEPRESGEKQYLSPLKRARLVHLLSRLPVSNTKLRKGDVARVTNFAITHAGSGAQEVVDLLLLNVEKPFCTSLAAKYESSDQEDDEADAYEPDEKLTNLDSPAPLAQKDSKRDEDPSNAKLIGLYIISDILSASSTAGARNAWKYRSLFESGLIHQKTFERLGTLDRELSWGRMKSDQWKRKIEVVFGIWENWSVFSKDLLEQMKTSFFGQPADEEEKAESGAEANKDGQEEKRPPLKVKQLISAADAKEFERIRIAAIQQSTSGRGNSAYPPGGLDGAMDDDMGGASKDLLEGKFILDGENDSQMKDATSDAPVGGLDGKVDAQPTTSESATATKAPPGPRRRMRAEDMFADSDDE